MKVKTMKILVFVATMLITMSLLATTVFAISVDDVFTKVDGAKNSSKANTDAITTLGGRVLDILQVAGIVIGIIILVVLGIKYMTGSLEEKAEYKKTMIPYVVGAVVVFAGPMLAKAIFTMISGISAS